MNVEGYYQWMKRWLIYIDEDDMEDNELIYLSDGHTYRLVAFFQLAFRIHALYQDQTANNYLWYVAENYVLYDHQVTHSVRFDTQDGLLWAVAGAAYASKGFLFLCS